MLKELLRLVTPSDMLHAERPLIEATRVDIQPEPVNAELAEYARLSKAVGYTNPHISADLEIERFKAFLRSKDWAVYSLDTVRAYMDEKSKVEGSGYGWQWHPMREKDRIKDAKFGRPSRPDSPYSSGALASDYYHGPHIEMNPPLVWTGGQRPTMLESLVNGPAPYNKLIPIHALKKVADIESEYKGSVSFFVCDYATAPHIVYPDPFLMAVINNNRLHDGVGRFVIDFWDEPGFGIDQQVAP